MKKIYIFETIIHLPEIEQEGSIILSGDTKVIIMSFLIRYNRKIGVPMMIVLPLLIALLINL